MAVFSQSEWVQSRIDEGYYTPDSAKIFRKPWHPIFVYGTLRSGFFRNKLLHGLPRVGTGFTRGKIWTMYRTQPNKAGSYPVALPTINKDEQGALYGEIYLVPPKLLRELDFIESNGIQYSRVSRAIDIVGQITPAVMNCWMYVGNHAAWEDEVKKRTLLPIHRMTRANEPRFHYYVFKKSDAN